MSGLRVALLDHSGGGYAGVLAESLRATGHDPRLLAAPAVTPVEAVLRRRGFTASLSRIPPADAALLRGGFDVAHAFSAPDAAAALVWRRLTGRPAVFTCIETLDRGTLSDRRLRLWTLQRAVEGSDALVAGGPEARQGLERWLALAPTVLAADDAAAHVRLYRELIVKAAKPVRRARSRRRAAPTSHRHR